VEEVEAESDSSVIRQVTWRYWIKGATHRAKPEHAHGAECASARLDHVPTSVRELTQRDVSTASPITMEFEEDERGDKLYCAFRWIGTTEGNEGVWSEIFSAIIP
jgi:hypothetical protein